MIHIPITAVGSVYMKKTNALASEKKPDQPKNYFVPPSDPSGQKLVVRVVIWGIFIHVNFLYNFLEFLQFFPELCDTWVPLGGPQWLWGGAPKWISHMGTPQQ